MPALYGSGYCAQTLGSVLFSFQSDCMPDLYSKIILNSKKPSGSSDLLHVCLTDGQLHLTQICLLWGDFLIFTHCATYTHHNTTQVKPNVEENWNGCMDLFGKHVSVCKINVLRFSYVRFCVGWVRQIGVKKPVFGFIIPVPLAGGLSAPGSAVM